MEASASTESIGGTSRTLLIDEKKILSKEIVSYHNNFIIENQRKPTREELEPFRSKIQRVQKIEDIITTDLLLLYIEQALKG